MAVTRQIHTHAGIITKVLSDVEIKALATMGDVECRLELLKIEIKKGKDDKSKVKDIESFLTNQKFW